jgi:REP element-mobilizing transposase RayT
VSGVQENPKRPERRNTRLPEFDYGQVGAYFVTVVTQGRECLFGEVDGVEMRLNDLGRITHEEWFRSADIREEIALFTGEMVVMPNHIHGIVWITGRGDRPVAPTSDTRSYPHGPAPRSLSAFVAGFKSSVTKRINMKRGTPGERLWQRNYHDHIIRDEDDLYRVREYIELNPARWAEDEENLENARNHERRIRGLIP